MDIEGKCPSCGAMMTNGTCEYCGYYDPRQKVVEAEPVYDYVDKKFSSKDWLTTMLLCVFLGWIGAHKFYEGKIGMGILYLLTCGVFGVCWLIDIIKILMNKEKDKGGLVIHRMIKQ